MPDCSLEDAIGGRVCGIDEAGRGPLAGPVVAGAVVLFTQHLDGGLLDALDDSKKLTARRRAALFDGLMGAAASGGAMIGIGEASVEEVDRLNILQAALLAMERAAAALSEAPDYALVDGNKLPRLDCPARAVIGGDGLSSSIAAASIVAKVTRDAIMTELDRAHPGYGFARNAGYGTAGHKAALARLGVTPHHRRSFAPIHNILYGDGV
jgi:ribonuclease HII